MTLQLGALDVVDVRLGGVSASKVMLGTVQVWPTGPATVTGAIAALELVDLVALVGSFTAAVAPITGELVALEAADAGAIVGSFTPLGIVGGDIAAAEDVDTAAIVGTVAAPVYTGTVVATDADDLAAIVGTSDAPIYTGTIVAVEADDTSAIVGSSSAPVYTGDLAATEDVDTSAIVATFGPTGVVAATEATDTPAITGSVTAGAFSPIDLTNCVLWLDAANAASFTFTSGSNINRWISREGGSRQFEVYVGTPARSGTVNSLAAVVMGGGTLRDWTSSGAPYANPVTMAVVAGIAGGNWNTVFGGGNLGLFRVGSDDSIAFFGGTTFVSVGASSIQRVNGVQQSTTNPGTDPLDFFRVGDGSPAVTVCEICVYNRALNSTELGQLDTYLRTKWGTA
jgi:hypothetical protein